MNNTRRRKVFEQQQLLLDANDVTEEVMKNVAKFITLSDFKEGIEAVLTVSFD